MYFTPIIMHNLYNGWPTSLCFGGACTYPAFMQSLTSTWQYPAALRRLFAGHSA
jgi:hypothetical protein